MIISCPSCATRYDLPRQQIAADGSVIRCTACGHSWLEASAVEVIDVTPPSRPLLEGPSGHDRHLPVLASDIEEDDSVAVDLESRRIAQAAARAERDYQTRRKARQAKLAGWGLLAGAIAATFAGLYAFPGHVVRFAPGAAQVYERAGIAVNLVGFEIRNVKQQHLLTDGTRVLALRGELVNVSGEDKKVPSLRFVLKDASKQEVYAWSLNGVSTEALPADQTTTFITRVAAPPESADEVEIRFARAAEIGSNAQP